MFKPGDNIISIPRTPEMSEGRHWRAKLGFILMSTDLAAEGDFFDMVPYDVAVHITRLKTDDYTTNETLSRHIDFMADAASRIQPDTKPNVISYSCTSGSIVIGEEKIKAEERNSDTGGTTFDTVGTGGILDLSAGDYVDVSLYQDTGSSQGANGGGESLSFFMGYKLIGV